MSCLPATGKLLDSKTDDKQEVLWDTWIMCQTVCGAYNMPRHASSPAFTGESPQRSETFTSQQQCGTRRGIRAEQRGDNSDRGMRHWNGLETLLFNAEIDTERMTEWNKSSRRNRNNGGPSRTNLNISLSHSFTELGCVNTLYALTRVYVLLLVCDMFSGRRVPPPNRLSCLKERVIGVSQTEGGLEEGGGGFGDAARASPSTESHHLSPDAHSRGWAIKTPRRSSVLLPEGSQWELLALTGSF